MHAGMWMDALSSDLIHGPVPSMISSMSTPLASALCPLPGPMAIPVIASVLNSDPTLHCHRHRLKSQPWVRFDSLSWRWSAPCWKTRTMMASTRSTTRIRFSISCLALPSISRLKTGKMVLFRSMNSRLRPTLETASILKPVYAWMLTFASNRFLINSRQWALILAEN